MKLKVSAVGYLNAAPLYKKLENSVKLSLDHPSECSAKLMNGSVDVGLIPIMGYQNSYFILPNIAIGSYAPVKSVLLVHKNEGKHKLPIELCETISLDPHSVSSNIITQIIMKEFIKSDVKFGNFSSPDARIVIGDEALKLYKSDSDVTDIASLWYKFTGLPVIFAFWASNKILSKETTDLFLKAKNEGINSIKSIAEEFSGENNYADSSFFEDYLSKSICYNLCSDQIKAIELEYKLAHKYSLIDKIKPRFL